MSLLSAVPRAAHPGVARLGHVAGGKKSCWGLAAERAGVRVPPSYVSTFAPCWGKQWELPVLCLGVARFTPAASRCAA